MATHFADIAELSIQSGRGGKGAVSFRREKFVPLGGPDGGDGGDGGDVVLFADRQERTLRNLRTNTLLKAEDGVAGSKNNRHGKNGKDLLLKVPTGTVVRDKYNITIASLDADGSSVVLLKGGRGGKGNAFFKSATRQAPKFSQSGEDSTSLTIIAELELIADFGFVGAPNVGKSTLLKTLTKANPKIGNYPFTTLVPNLGTLKNYEQEIILADIPGLIEGAASGLGLGIQFLKHIKKTVGLVFLLDTALTENWLADGTLTENSFSDGNVTTKDLVRSLVHQYTMLHQELASYDESLLSKPQVIVLSKVDMSIINSDMSLQTETITFFVQALNEDTRYTNTQFSNSYVLPISSYTGHGLDALKTSLFALSKLCTVS